VIDLHSHVLPGVDDGPADLEGSLALARAAVAAGTTLMVATPHVNHDHDVQPTAIHDAVERLRWELDRNGIALELRPGAEIALSRMTTLTESELASMRLGGGPYLLLESPFTSAVGDLEKIVFELRLSGHEVLLAHPERCPAFQRDPGLLRRLVDKGALVSITAGSMTGDFGGTVRRFCLDLLAEGLVHDVASDAHDDDRRPPGVAGAFEAAERELPGVSDRREWLTQLVPAAILAGERLPAPPPPPGRARGGWRKLTRRGRRAT